MDNFSPDQIKAMIAMLQNMLPQNTEEQAQSKSTHTIKKRTTNKKNNTDTKKKKSDRPNKFMDMPEMNMHKEDILVDKKLSVQPPVPRARPFNMVNAICRVCGKREEVNPGLIHDGVDRYKCNKCSSSAG